MTFALRAGVTVTRSVVILGTLSTLVLVRAGIPVPLLAAWSARHSPARSCSS